MAKLTDSARKLLEGENLLFVASVGRDGSPQITPTWVDTDGAIVLINTSVGRVKQRNLTRDPRVALAVTDQNDFFNLALIRGRVVEQVTPHAPDGHLDKVAKKYLGMDKYPYCRPDDQRVVLKVEPERVTTTR